nr:uncharacterized protein LOC109742038 isoform X1 [Aegilops tauschii subsp. strangulata]
MDHDHSLSRAGYVRHVGQLDSMPGAAVACIEHPSRYILESKNKGAVRVVSPANNNTRRGDRSCLQPAAFQMVPSLSDKASAIIGSVTPNMGFAPSTQQSCGRSSHSTSPCHACLRVQRAIHVNLHPTLIGWTPSMARKTKHLGFRCIKQSKILPNAPLELHILKAKRICR